MAELNPCPLRLLVTRAFRELDERQSIFDLPRQKFFPTAVDRDLAVRFHGRPAGTPFGPAAGPHSQLAQNIVLAWLGGGRIFELKTIQINDQLSIPRPCIDMRAVGYNVEWSQELKLEQSLEEYLKAAMLIRMLAEKRDLAPAAPLRPIVFDMSVGYDLAGIRSDRVTAFIRGMLDCSALVDSLRREIPPAWRAYRDLDFPTRLSDTLTLSTFHGCPPAEIERIIEFLMEEHGLDCVIKFNPLLLGRERTRELLNDTLGYHDVSCPDAAFERDTTWEQATDIVERLEVRARAHGLGFGVKFSNTLIVENRGGFLPAGEQEMYLSGPPLHVLAMNLVGRFRQRFGGDVPVSFAAGIDRRNFPDAVALGLVPVTVCTDLLKPGGYGRARTYLDELLARMERVEARSIGEFILRAYGLGRAALDRLPLDQPTRLACETALVAGGDPAAAAGAELFDRWCREATVLNTAHYVPRATADERYRRPAVEKPPKKIGSRLELFDCVSCDKCVPVCPNAANFTFVLPRAAIPVARARLENDAWNVETTGRLEIREQHQIGNFADFCNECGNCDVFCPEDGGPYRVKPRFFGGLEQWRAARDRDGFCLVREGAAVIMHGRVQGAEFCVRWEGGRVHYGGPGFAVTFAADDPAATFAGRATDVVDLTWFHLMTRLRDAVFAADELNWAALAAAPRKADETV